MTKLNKQKIIEKARQFLDEKPSGARWSEILKHVSDFSPETPINSIHGSVHLFLSKDDDVEKIARGTYALKKYVSVTQPIEATVEAKYESTFPAIVQSIKEEDFYAPFSEWLRDEIEDVTEAISIGGNIFKSKWGTPDVMGVLRPQTSDMIKFENQIVSAEIKIDTNATVTAFGQAVAYKLFSHKSYIVIPRSTTKNDISRIESLCVIFGIGLVIFDIDKNNPNFSRLVHAPISNPDPYYMNEMANRLREYSKAVFDKLF